MKVTISDVAKLAGVSTATVSHTINNTRYVSSETKEKVYSAIAELGYTPDASARSFRTGKKKTVGFIVPDISNKFFATMIESVENYLSMHGYHLIIANIGGLPRLSTTKERISAYQQAVADCGLPDDPELIRYGDSMENSAQACLEELLEQKCDAIIVCQGLMASETMIYLHKKGYDLSRDIDLVSFMDYDSNLYQLYSNQMDSIVQPVVELGEAAGEQILRRIEKPDAPIFEKVLTSAYRPYNAPQSWAHSDR